MPLGTCSKKQKWNNRLARLNTTPQSQPYYLLILSPPLGRSPGDWMVITQCLCSSFVSTVRGFPLVAFPRSSAQGVEESEVRGFRHLGLSTGLPLPIFKGSCAGHLPGNELLSPEKARVRRRSQLALCAYHLPAKEYGGSHMCGFLWISSISPFRLFIAALFRAESSRAVALFNIVGPLQGHLKNTFLRTEWMCSGGRSLFQLQGIVFWFSPSLCSSS